MTNGDVIKHDRNTDVAFHIYKIYRFNNEYQIKGYWINIVNPDKTYVIDVDHIIITENEIPNWKVIDLK